MEEEKFFSGYCRCLDGPRTVELLLEDGKVTEVDCRYGDCPHQASCPIAREMDAYK